MRIKMIRDRFWTPPTDRRQSFDYRTGQTYTIKRDWGEVIVAEGAAREVAAKKTTEAPDDGSR